MSYQRDRDEFIGVIVNELITLREAVDVGIGLARLILRNASIIQRIGETACNRELQLSEEKHDVACQTRITDACTPYGITPTFHGDPRGACVKLLLPSGRYNSWGGRESGYCVPTR